MKTATSNKKIRYAFIIITIVQLAVIIFCFTVKKEGWNADEMWSYGYANSYYQKDVFCDNDQNVYINMWMDADFLRDYLVVNDGERFAYDSIYHNQIEDMSPPAHSMILHTICSFFPNKFSLWFSFPINIISFIVAMIYLYRWVSLFKSEKFALMVCTFYGFSSGAIDDFIYLRMYAFITALLMMVLYYMLLFIKTDDKKICNKCIIKAYIVSLIGFLTHYYFISMIGLLTFFFCVYLLFKKQIKKMFKLGLAMLISLITSFALFNNIFNKSLGHTQFVAQKNAEVYNYNFQMRFIIMLNSFLRREFKVGISFYRSMFGPLFLGISVFLLIVCMPLFILLRDTKFIKSVVYHIRHIGNHIVNVFKKTNWVYVFMVFAFILQLIVIGETCQVAGMGDFVDRYVFFMMPIGIFLVFNAAYFILKCCLKILKKHIKVQKMAKILFNLAYILLIAVNMVSLLYYSPYYFDKENDGVPLEEAVKDANIVYIDSSIWLITALAPYFMNGDEYFYTNGVIFDKYKDEYMKKLNEGRMVLVINKNDYTTFLGEDYNVEIEQSEGVQNEIDRLQEKYDSTLEFFEDLQPDTKMKYITTQTVFHRKMVVYEINP